MSRSRRKSPCCGITTAVSDKPFKQQENRRERRAVKQQIDHKEELPHRKQFGNPWYAPKDGKIWWGWDKQFLYKHESIMRK